MTRVRRRSPQLPRVPAPAGVLPHARLAALRMERHLSIARLAALAGLRPNTISDLERGMTLIPQQRTLTKLAATYGISLEQLQQEIGMSGLRSEVGATHKDAPEAHDFSPCAEEVAGLVDRLPVHERRFVLSMCQLLQTRQAIALPIVREKE